MPHPSRIPGGAPRTAVGLLAGVLSAAAPGMAGADPLLPDLYSVADAAKQYMYGGTFDTTSEPGRVLYRFNTAIANLGDGPFQVYEVTDANQNQDVYQDIFDSGGGFTRTLMASFDNADPPFGHLHLEELALYNLRAVTPDNGVGDVVASHAKTSHAVVDSVAIDTSLPAAPSSRVYNNIFANPLGISVGYADLYSKNIDKQRIDVTGLASGQYWLEVVVDPVGYVQETDETNNVTHILVDLTIPAGAATVAGDYDNSGSVDQGDLDLVLLNWGEDVNATGIPNYWVNDRPSGTIDQAELDGVLLNWGNTAEPAGGVVPEPGVFTLVAAGAALLGLRRSA